jgi:putative ABC transport system permease protein
MRWLNQLRMRFLMLFRHGPATAGLDDELRFHLDRQVAENLAAGMSREEARYAALRTFGNPALLRDQTRFTWGWDWLESFWRDLRYAFRALRRTPGFTSIAVGVMALGICANVALFTVVRGVILKPLPFQDPGRLVMLYETKSHNEDASGHNFVAGGIYAEWKKQNHTFSNMALVSGALVGLSGSGGHLPEKLRSGEFSWDLLPTLGVQPAFGRNFTQSEDSPSSDGKVLLSWSLWQRRFGGDRGILNQTVYIDSRPFTVIGVMPAWFDFPNPSTQLWLPISHERSEGEMTAFSNHMFRVVGRLKPGVTQAQAVADLSLISLRIHNANLSDPFIFSGANSRPLLDHIVGNMKQPLLILLGATACVLLIACLNVANLLVARAASRQKDLAIRTALGGGWMRLMRERVMESLLLSVFGGTIGIVLSNAALKWLVHTRPDLSRVENIHFDVVVAAFTVAVIALCALISGLIAAFSAWSKTNVNVLQESSRTLSSGRAKASLHRILLSIEVSLTVVLLIGAGLLLKSYERLRSNDMGCLTENILTLHTGLPDARYGPAARIQFLDTFLNRVRALPGVAAAGFVDGVPGQGYLGDDTFSIVEHPPLPQGKGQFALHRTADPGYFEAIGIPVRRGRIFNPSLRLNDADEIVVDQLFVNTFFPGEEPLGKHIQTNKKKYVIVGVVGATRFEIGENPLPMIYYSLEGGNQPFGTIVIRSNQDVGQFALPVQRMVSEMDPDLVISDVLTMDQLLGKSTLDSSFNAILLVAFATLSLILAAAGLFGVLSYIAAQRTGEIGIRIALGAQREEVLRLMLMDGMWPALFGLAAGLLISAGAARLLRSMLYQTPALDPVVFAVVAFTLLLVAVIACMLPAWRVSRLDPVQALRTD